MSYLGQAAQPRRVTAERYQIVATAGQTDIPSLEYTVGQVDVFRNGIKQVEGDDFNADNGTNISFTSALAVDDLIEVIALRSFVAAAHPTYAEQTADLSSKYDKTGGTLTGNITVEDPDGGWSPDSKTVFRGQYGDMGYVGHNSSDVLELMNYSMASTMIGTNGAPRIIVDMQGRVTMPYQPAFGVKKQQTEVAGVITGYQATNVNIGGHMNLSSGVFTAPVSGSYLLSAVIIAEAGESYYMYIRVNGATKLAVYDYDATTSDTSSGSIVVYLNANDTADVYVSGAHYSCNFSGHLIG